MRRRRLALREIKEPPDAQVAGDSDSDVEIIEEPNFNLLGLAATGAGAGADAVAQPSVAVAEPAAGDTEHTSTARHVPSVFHLYQDGLVPEQMLQLAFMRRRAPRSLRDAKVRVEDEFVVPRPTLSLADFLPARADVPLEKLWLRSNPIHAGGADAGADSAPLANASERSRAVASASKFFTNPREATDEEFARWRRLSERDWRQVYHESKQRSSLDIADVGYGMARCRSDALVQFVWEDLLAEIVGRALHEPSDDADSEESTEAPREPLVQRLRELLQTLVRHPWVAGMSPKQFRAAVRAKNLRQVDAAAGAELELELVAQFQRQRQQQQQQLRAHDADVSQRRTSSKR